jgi:hypothetical protein
LENGGPVSAKKFPLWEQYFGPAASILAVLFIVWMAFIFLELFGGIRAGLRWIIGLKE